VCCSALQCVAVCCGVLQCAAERYSLPQCITVSCSVLHCCSVCCSVLQCEVFDSVLQCVLQCVAVCCSVLFIECLLAQVSSRNAATSRRTHLRKETEKENTFYGSLCQSFFLWGANPPLVTQCPRKCIIYIYIYIYRKCPGPEHTYRVAKTHRMPQVAGYLPQKSH